MGTGWTGLTETWMWAGGAANTQKLLSNFLLALLGDFVSLEIWAIPAMSVPPGLDTLSPEALVFSHIEKRIF